MVQIAKSYPIFEDNQVLTSGQLNELASYLDEQNRLTRVTLIGIGIFCGLDLSWENQGNSGLLTISSGVGVTSEGYLIHQCDCILTQYLNYSLPETVQYPPFEMGDGEADLTFYELFPANAKFGKADQPQPLTQSFLMGKVVLLFLECFDEDLESCLGKSCDELGIRRNFNLRKLLVSREDADRILLKANCKEQSWSPYELTDIAMPRPLFQPEGTESREYNALSNNYRKAILQKLVPLQNLLYQSYELYSLALSPLYNGKNPFDKILNGAYNTIVNDWNNYLNSAVFKQLSFFRIQYFYDFLKDLILAYREFRKAVRDLDPVGSCCPDLDCFPKHLMLGQVISKQTNNCSLSPYRHYFRTAPFSKKQNDQIEHIQVLHRRLWLMVEKFDLAFIRNAKVNKEIKITPSCEKKGPLAERAIPFYYRTKESSSPFPQLGTLEQAWIIDAHQKCLPVAQRAVISYENHQMGQNGLGPKVTPLDFDLDPFNFLRIEGHQGLSVTEAVGQLEQFRKAKNLAFDIRTAWIGSSGLLTLEPGNCVVTDLQPQYDIWRKRLSYWLNKGATLLHHTLEALYREGALEDLVQFEETKDPQESVQLFLHRYVQLLQNINDLESRPLNDGFLSDEREQLINLLDHELNTFRGLLQLLPCKLRDFSLPDWLIVLKSGFEVYIDKLMKFLADKARTPQEVRDITELLHFMTGFYSLLSSYVHYPVISLQVLSETLGQRIAQLSKDISFSQLITEHPGIDHQAGVAPGGTFILVYQGKNPFSIVRIPETRTTFPVAQQQVITGLSGFLSSLPQVPGEKIVTADFSLPYICCEEDCDLPDICVNPRPIALPVVAVLQCRLVEQLRISAQSQRKFDPLKIYILEDLYDPEVYEIKATSNPKYGLLSTLQEVYEPAPDKNRTVIQYVYNPDAMVKKKIAGIMVDTFNYQIRDKKKGIIIGSSTATIFIPLCVQAEDEPPPRTNAEIQLVYKGTKSPFQESAIVRLSGPENLSKQGTASSYLFENILVADYTVTLESDKYWATPVYFPFGQANAPQVVVLEVCIKLAILNGQIFDKEKKVPVAQARIYLPGIEDISGESKDTGNYSLRNVPIDIQGERGFLVRVEHPDYELLEQFVPLNCAPEQVKDFYLLPIKRHIKGQVFYKQQSGKLIPVGGIPLTISDLNRKFQESFSSVKGDPEVRVVMGGFEFSNLRPGIYRITADGGLSFTSSYVEVNVIRESVTDVQIVLEPKIVQRINGQVIQEGTKSGIQGAEVRIKGLENQMESVITGGKGEFSFSNIPLYLQPETGFIFEAKYLFRGKPFTGEATYRIPTDGLVTIILQIPETQTIPASLQGKAVYFLRGTEIPAGGVEISIPSLGNRNVISNAKTGAFQFDKLPPGQEFILNSKASSLYSAGTLTVNPLRDGENRLIVFPLNLNRSGSKTDLPILEVPTKEETIDSAISTKPVKEAPVKEPISGAPVKEEPELPIKEETMDSALATEPPVKEAPTKDPILEVPVKEEPEIPTKEETVDSTLATEPPVKEVPVKDPISEAPVKAEQELPMKEETVDSTLPTKPVKEAPIKDPISEVPVKAEPEIPTKEDTVDSTLPTEPVKESPIKDPILEAPVKEAPIKDPISESPVKEAPELPTKEETIDSTLATEPPVKEAPIKDPISEVPVKAEPELPTKEETVDSTLPTEPVKEAPIKDPISEAPVKEEPELPVKEETIDSTLPTEPVKEVPVKDPISEAPVKEAPELPTKEETIDSTLTTEPPVKEAPIKDPISEVPVKAEPELPTKEETVDSTLPTELVTTDPVKDPISEAPVNEKSESPSKFDLYMEDLRKKSKSIGNTPLEVPAKASVVKNEGVKSTTSILPPRDTPYAAEEIREGIRQRLEQYIEKIWDRALSTGNGKDPLINDATEAIRYFSQITEDNSVRLNYRFGMSRDDLVQAIQQYTGQDKTLYIQALVGLTQAYLDKLAISRVSVATGMSVFTLRETARLYNETDGIELQEIIIKWMEGIEHWADEQFLQGLVQNFQLK